MRWGYENPIWDIKQQFYKYSDAYNWSEEAQKRSIHQKLTESNVLIFMNETKLKIPNSVNGNKFCLEYLGLIESKTK